MGRRHLRLKESSGPHGGPHGGPHATHRPAIVGVPAHLCTPMQEMMLGRAKASYAGPAAGIFSSLPPHCGLPWQNRGKAVRSRAHGKSVHGVVTRCLWGLFLAVVLAAALAPLFPCPMRRRRVTRALHPYSFAWPTLIVLMVFSPLHRQGRQKVDGALVDALGIAHPHA